MIVEDDGVGFDLDAVHDRRQSMGLSGLVARATQVGGRAAAMSAATGDRAGAER